MYTTTDYSKVQAAAREVLAALHVHKSGDKRDEWFLTDGSPDWMRDIMLAGNADTSFYYAYEYAHEALEAIVRADADESEIREEIGQIEADIYTRDLTAWLAENVNHVSWMDEVMNNGLWNDGTAFNLLQCAQMMHKQAVAFAVLNALEERAEDIPDEDDSESEWLAGLADLGLSDGVAFIRCPQSDGEIIYLSESDFDYSGPDTNIYPWEPTVPGSVHLMDVRALLDGMSSSLALDDPWHYQPLTLDRAIERAKAQGVRIIAGDLTSEIAGYWLRDADNEYLQFGLTEDAAWRDAFVAGLI